MTDEERRVWADGEIGGRTFHVIPRLNQLLDQRKHVEGGSAAKEWRFVGPADALLKMMRDLQDGAPDGLPLTGADLIAYLQGKDVARAVRKEHKMHVTFPPHPRSRYG